MDRKRSSLLASAGHELHEAKKKLVLLARQLGRAGAENAELRVLLATRDLELEALQAAAAKGVFDGA